MKNKNFFYLQYNKINWENQEKTHINSFVNNKIIHDLILKNKSPNIKIFDIGFGIGFFFKMLAQKLKSSYKNIFLAGCEPSDKNYNYFVKKNPLKNKKNIQIRAYKDTFQNITPSEKFNFITAIYVFPHFSSEDADDIAKKIYYMLEERGKFILVVANDKYLEKKLKTKKDLFIEKNVIRLYDKKYKELLHYSDISKIGKIIDYNREEKYYLDLFKKNNLKLISKKDLNDNGFICTMFVFAKE